MREILPSSAARPPELTVLAVILGLVLSLVMGAANVYLGLKAGMTVSASIPAAVMAMGILRGLLGRKSLLEANLVQTAASAGESLAAGIIFTMPALLLIGVWKELDYWMTTLIALSGGLLGVLLMVPMRRVFVVDNDELRFPEGVACAEVLRAGSAESSVRGEPGLGLVLTGIAIGGGFKLTSSFLGLIHQVLEGAIRAGSRIFYVGLEVSPALMAVGFIVGLPVASQIFLGGAIGWLIAIPLLSGSGTGSETDASALDAAWMLWRTEVRYVGVGAMLVGGIESIYRVRGGLAAAMRELSQGFRQRQTQPMVAETERNLSGTSLLIWSLLCVLLIGGLYFRLLHQAWGLTVLVTLIMLVMAFFFTAVASYIVGLVGNSNSPVSGMTITAVMGAGLLIALGGYSGELAMIATLGIAGVICCVTCTSGDVCNDLKTGSLIGASPRRQQIMQILGVVVAAFIMAPVMSVLHEGSLKAGTGGIGGRELSAPQANLFASLAKGFFGDETLPREMVLYGIGLACAILLINHLFTRNRLPYQLHVMPVAVGIYLPFGLALPILCGGILHQWVTRRAGAGRELAERRGILLTSGMIAGESLLGVGLGIAAYLNVKTGLYSPQFILSLAAFLVAALLIGWLSSQRPPATHA